MTPAGIREASPAVDRDEIWLRGNVRPVVAVAAAGLGGLVAAVAAAWLAGVIWLVATAAVTGLAAAVLLAAMAIAASRPRLVRRGPALVIRLSPATTFAVPLDSVECFFPGSSPLDVRGRQTCGDHATWRINTLVMRLAERAVDQQSRRTFTPWGTWDDGYVVFDGRWCEPLSGDLARGLSRRLLDARREIVAAREQGVDT